MSNLEYLRDNADCDDLVLDIGSKSGEDMATIPTSTIATDLEFQSTESDTQYALADGTKLPFQTNSFDYVYCNHVLEHVNNKDLLLKEIQRVTRPGGEALFAFPNRLSPHAPHSPPGWYSYLPKSVGRWLGPVVLDKETEQYYNTSEYMLSPILARYLLNKSFDEVKYVVFENKTEYGGKSQRTGITGRFQSFTNQYSDILSKIIKIPVVGRIVELFYPPVVYRCKVY